MKRLEGKVAIVTGGASGIGAASSLALADEGAHVVCCDVNERQNAEIASEARRNGLAVETARVDVSVAAQVRALVESVHAKQGRIDVLVANAGYQFVQPLADVEESDWDRIMNVNLKGMFLFSKYVIPAMVKQKSGCIIAMGSVLSMTSAPGLAPYCASKAAILNLVRGIACDYGAHGIRANCICPGCIDTPLAQVFFAAQSSPQLAKEKSAAAHMLGRIGTPAEVAKAVVFLASDDSSFVTGSALVVDGGLSAKL